MKVDLMDVRLDEKKLPYAVRETAGEYLGDSRMKMNNPETVVKILNEVFHMKDFAEERLYLLLMSKCCYLIAFVEVSRGLLDTAPFGVREIMQRALLCNAAGIVLAHNHPSLGSIAEPSEEDILVTHRIVDACKLMGVTFCDHIIIADDQYYSFREKYIEKQEKEKNGR